MAVKKEEKKPVAKKAVVKEEKKPVAKKAAVKEEKKPVAKKAVVKEEKKTVVKKVEVKKEVAASKTYHLTYRKDVDKWQIILTHGEKAIKLFKTKAEAETYLKELAANQKANVSIKKKDGKFQKQK